MRLEERSYQTRRTSEGGEIISTQKNLRGGEIASTQKNLIINSKRKGRKITKSMKGRRALNSAK